MDIRKETQRLNRQKFGRILTLNRMINLRQKRINQNKSEINQFESEREQLRKEIHKITQTFEPKVYFMKKKQSKKYIYWKGRVRFWGKDYDFQIGTEEIYKSKSEDYWTEHIRKKFRKTLTIVDVKDYLDSFKNNS